MDAAKIRVLSKVSIMSIWLLLGIPFLMQCYLLRKNTFPAKKPNLKCADLFYYKSVYKDTIHVYKIQEFLMFSYLETYS